MSMQPDIHKTLYIWPKISMWDSALPGSNCTRYAVLQWQPALRRFRHIGVADTMYDADRLMLRIDRRAHRRRARNGGSLRTFPFRRFRQCLECAGAMRSVDINHRYCHRCEEEWSNQPWY